MDSDNVKRCFSFLMSITIILGVCAFLCLFFPTVQFNFRMDMERIYDVLALTGVLVCFEIGRHLDFGVVPRRRDVDGRNVPVQSSVHQQNAMQRMDVGIQQDQGDRRDEERPQEQRELLQQYHTVIEGMHNRLQDHNAELRHIKNSYRELDFIEHPIRSVERIREPLQEQERLREDLREVQRLREPSRAFRPPDLEQLRKNRIKEERIRDRLSDPDSLRQLRRPEFVRLQQIRHEEERRRESVHLKDLRFNLKCVQILIPIALRENNGSYYYLLNEEERIWDLIRKEEDLLFRRELKSPAHESRTAKREACRIL